jgi:polyhydroxybutyrate depolymerase
MITQSLVLIALAAIAAEPLTPGDHTRKLTVDERERNYLVHVPPKYKADAPTPVVLVFHGGGSNADQMMRYSGMNDKADAETFIAVYPNGTGPLDRILLTFNGGNCCGSAVNNDVDDVEFTGALLDDLATVANVNAKRVFSTGLSNGGIMSYRLASELSDRIAAIAPVGGTMGSETCKPSRPVPVMHFHGTEDKFVPYDGGRGSRTLPKLRFQSVEHTMDAWAKADGCAAEPKVTHLPDTADDGMTVERHDYGACKDGAEVVLIKIVGGGHTWPGRDLPVDFLGKSTRDISANDMMWEFFQRHPMP